MDPPKILSSFIQYKRCSLCRVNHNKGKKHIYSKKHVETLDSVIVKLAAKIEKANDELKKPVFHTLMSNVSPSNFWCYFCSSEAPKEMQLDDLRVSSLGIIEHIASLDHKKKTLAFWNDNHISRSRMQPFICLDDDFQKLKSRLQEQAVTYLQEQKQTQAEAAKKFELETKRRTRLVEVCREMQQQKSSRPLQSRPYQARNNRTGQTSVQSDAGGMKTIAAHGPNLTCIKIQGNSKSTSGNVHSGALPPWMQEDGDDNEATAAEAKTDPIGPTSDDFAKHLANQKKRKLPSTRVGAKFDRKGNVSETWLPSFGRVWSKNRRLHGQNSFTRAMKFNRRPRSPSETTTSSSNSKRFKSTDRPFHKDSVVSGFSGANGDMNFEHTRNDFHPTSLASTSRTLPGAYKSKRRNCSTVTSNGNRQINIAPNLL